MKAVLRQLTFRRLALALLPTAALTAGVMAFGRDDAERRASAPSRPQPTLPSSTTAEEDEDVLGVSAQPEEPLDAPPATKRRSRKPVRDAGDDVSADPAPPEPDPTADTGAAVRQAVTDTVASMGFAGARVSVSDGGRAVEVALAARQACDGDAGDRLVQRIRSSLPEVRTVRVSVRGSGQSLSEYRRSRCEDEPAGAGGGGGRGEVVYSKRGSGTFTTPTFAIAGRTWTVTYRNDSDFFQAFVVKDGRIQSFVLNSSRRGTRTESLRGPGRFRLRINGAAGWSVTVRDGA